MKIFTKGDSVMVYQDPITQKNLEGRAILVKRISCTRDTMHIENWKVRFISDDFITERLINVS